MPPAPQRVGPVAACLVSCQTLPSYPVCSPTPKVPSKPFKSFETHDFPESDYSACVSSSLCQVLHNKHLCGLSSVKPYAFPWGKHDFPEIASILRRVGETKDLFHGKAVHTSLKRRGYDYYTYIGNCIIQMYGNCGSIVDARAAFDVIQSPNLHSHNILIQAYALNGHFEEACAVFESMSKRNVVSWTAIISCAAQQGFCGKAMMLFHRMEGEGIAPNIITFISILETCSALEEGCEIHSLLVMQGFEEDIMVATALITMYGSCGSVMNAKHVFTTMPDRNVVSWGALITALTENGWAEESLKLFLHMNKEDVVHDKVIYICALNACASYAALEEGQNVHTKTMQDGFERDTTVGNALVTFYGRSGNLDSATLIFLKMLKRDTASWSAIISACAQNGNPKEALKLFNQMELQGFQPHVATHVSVLNACSDLMAWERGREIHLTVAKNGSEIDTFIGNSLVNLYGKCGRLAEARSAFIQIVHRDVISWNSIISVCAQSGHSIEALEHFHQMLKEGVEPNNLTFTFAMEACTSVEQGKRAHVTSSNAACKPNAMVGASLVTTYGGCACLDNTRIIDKRVLEQSTLAWSTVVEAGRQSGCERDVLDILHQAQQCCVKLNEFTSVLTACHHPGFYHEKRGSCTIMQKGGNMSLIMHDYAGMIDILNRAGHLPEAEDFLRSLPNASVIMSWFSLLCFCRLHGDVQRAHRAAYQCLELDRIASPYLELTQLFTPAS